MGLLCVVPTLLDFGLDPLLHVFHMNVGVCVDCKHARYSIVLVPTSNTIWLLLCGQPNYNI